MSSENFTRLRPQHENVPGDHTEAARSWIAAEQALREKRIGWISDWIDRAYTETSDQEKREQWSSILRELPDIPLRFLEHILRTTTDIDRILASPDDVAYWVRGDMERLRTQLLASGFRHVRGSFPIAKTESGLEARVFGRRTVLINTISKAAQNAWVSAETIVPVSPVFREMPTTDEQVRIVTRYCGESIGDVLELTAELLARHKSDDVERAISDFVQEVDTQKTAIAAALFEAGISHGHMHFGNFTVELIRRRYLESTTGQKVEKRAGRWQLPSGKKMNSVPYSESDVAFGLSRYFDEPGEWVPVVRLIDFDHAMVHTPRPSFQQWLKKDPHGSRQWRMEELLSPRGGARIKDAWRGVVRKVVTSVTFGRAADGGVRMTVEQDNRRPRQDDSVNE